MRAALLGGVAALAACAPMHVAFDPISVAARVADVTGIATTVITTDADAGAVRQRVGAALARPLTAEAAVQIAVLNNRALQVAYLANKHGDAAVLAALELIAATRRAYVLAVAAQQVAGYFEQALASAEATAELTRRLAQAGGANRLDQARAAELYVEVANDLRRARLDATLAREDLARVLGLWGTDIGYALPLALPPLPAILTVPADAEAEAIRRRADLEAARHALGHDGATAAHRLEALAIQIRSEVRVAYATYQTSYEVARVYRDEVVPLRRTIDDEIVYRYNGMLVDVFTVLATVRESLAANVAAITALRDFHLAEANFRATLIGGGVAPSATRGVTPHAEAVAGGH
jgi:outer membrane protein TolC